MKKATIKDVAKYANVSISTVSNVLNNVDKASEETKKKVLEAMDILDYHPNLTARSLVSKKSNIIGIILPKNNKLSASQVFIGDNPFFTEYLSGIEYSARQKNYDVLITGIEDEEECKRWILNRDIDAVIFTGRVTVELIQKLEELKIPFSLMDTNEDEFRPYNRVGVDDTYGGYIATKHLLDLGHKKVAFITHRNGLKSFRFKGYQKALSEVKIEVDEAITMETGLGFQQGYIVGTAISRMPKEYMPTAVVATADIIAFGIMKALITDGKRVPEDISIIGFDDVKECEYVTPGLTTIHQDIFQKGAKTVEVLIDDVEKGTDEKLRIELPVKLIVRESTKRL